MVDSTLTNQSGVTLDGKWKIDGKNITNVEDASKVFGVVDNGKDAGTEVNVAETLSVNDLGQQDTKQEVSGQKASGQHWERSADNGLGYFTLKNLNSGKFLSAVTPDKITIEGM